MRSRIVRSKRREGERGFALLLVFLIAAGIALMLYQQLPRVAFESERDKEQLLIDRGEQYKRAIQEFFVAYKRYPTTIEELEKTNDKRYLRHRYIDPYTGKDEWRLVHVNGAGQLTDSLVTKPPGDPNNPNKNQLANNGPLGSNPGGANPSGANGAGASGANPSSGGFGALASNLAAGGNPQNNLQNTPQNNPQGFPTGGFPGGVPGGTGVPGAPDGPAQVNAAVLRRPSDRALAPGQFPATAPSAPVDPNNPNQSGNGQGVNPNDPNGFGQNGFQNGQPGFPTSDPFNNQNNNYFSPADLPPISLQAIQQQTNPNGNNGAPGQQPFPGQVPGQSFPGQSFPFAGQGVPGVPSQPGVPGQFGNQVRIGQNGQFIPVNPNQNQNGQPGQQSFPGAGFPPGAFPGGGAPFPGAAGSSTGQSFQPGVPGQPGDPNAFAGTSGPGGQGFGNPPQPGGQPIGQPVGQPGTQPGMPNTALGLINQILTTPRQPPAGVSAGPGSNVTSGGLGIAGVASTYDGPSVKIYKERKKFKEWEFIFDMQSQNPALPAAGAGTGTGNNAGTGTGNNQTPTGSTPGSPGIQPASPFNAPTNAPIGPGFPNQ